MAKIRGIVLEKVMHESEGQEVLRLTRDVTVHVEHGDGPREIIKAFQDALAQVLPFVANGRRGRDKRAFATIVITPVSGKVRNEVARTLATRVSVGGFSEWHKYKLGVNAWVPMGIAATILTPYPDYPIWPVHKSGSNVVLFDGGSDLGV